MSEPSLLDRTHSIILRRFVETGQAPHYTEIAKGLGVSVEEGRKALHDLIGAGVPGWLYPKTDIIVSMAPFNSLMNQFRITIDGQQKWFGQWAFESLAVCWLFPGKTVRIDSPCLDCGEPIRVEIKDGKILKTEPDGVIGHVSVPFLQWMENPGYAWSTMVFFRSEEHLKNWADYTEEKKDGIIPLPDLVKLFSIEFFRRRLDADYVSRIPEYMGEFFATLKGIGKTGPFWVP